MKTYSQILAILLVLLLPSLGFSQEDPMTDLNGLAGNWEIENFVNEDNLWKNIGNTTSVIELVHDGRFIPEKPTFLTCYCEINMPTNKD